MNKTDRNIIIGLGLVFLLGWLASKERYRCPRCNYPVVKENIHCPNCGQPLKWGAF